MKTRQELDDAEKQKRDLLLEILPDELDEGVAARLLMHPSDRVQCAAKDLVTSSTADDATIDVE